MYGTASASDPRLKDILFDDYGRFHTFEFELPRGIYDVTVSVGWNSKNYKNNTIYVNGIEFFNDEPTTAAVSYLNRTKQINCYNNRIFLEMGDGKEYTMLNYMIIKLNSTNVTFRDLDVVILDEETDDNSTTSSNKSEILSPPIIIASMVIYLICLGLLGI